MTTKTRNSNFELLRIIAITFIVIWHISIHAQKGELASHNYILAITITGVNLFVLISGYFGIKLSWRSLLTFVSTIAYYNIITIILKWGITGTPPDIDSIKFLLEPIKESRWWFINCYFNLMLLSPIINIALNKCTERQLKYFLGVLLFISCISGFCFRNSINLNGYNTFQFVTMYVLGNAIHKFELPARFSTKYFSAIYLTTVLCIFISSFILIPGSRFYNNPLVIISAVCFFCIIAKMNFYNRTINHIATFTFPVYLFQDSIVGSIAYDYLYDKGKILEFEGFYYYTIICTYILALLCSTFIFEHIRRGLFKRPINSTSTFLDKRLNFFH